MLQWLIRFSEFAEFTEFPFRNRETPNVSKFFESCTTVSEGGCRILSVGGGGNSIYNICLLYIDQSSPETMKSGTILSSWGFAPQSHWLTIDWLGRLWYLMLITYFLSGGLYILIGGFKGGAKDAPLSVQFLSFSWVFSKSLAKWSGG